MASELNIAHGTFLAAGPELLDPNFMHTVVMMCQHSDQGAYGLVINRPSEFRACDVLSSHALLKASELRLYVGGPVSLETLQVLHRAPQRIPGGVQIADDLWIGGELDDIARYALEDPGEAERKVRLYLGYSGWGAGQLEFELAAGSWLPAPGAASRVFQTDFQSVWREVVRGLGPEYRGLADEPPEPEWN
jgi:putative transcriptional regulator